MGTWTIKYCWFIMEGVFESVERLFDKIELVFGRFGDLIRVGTSMNNDDCI